jgi:DNA-binding response OmpR family regulator
MQSLSVIYIEDNEQEAFIVQVALEDYGIGVHIIPHITTDQVNTLQAPPYNEARALLIDTVLFNGDSGLEIARALRERGDSRAIYLVSAGQGPDPKQLDALQIQFLMKPFKFDALAAELQRL